MTVLPTEVRDLLGEAPERITRFGSAEVLRGNGLVAKAGPTAGRNAAALGATLHLDRPNLIPPPVTAAELDAALVLVTVTQNLVALRDERGRHALGGFVAERVEALERVSLTD